MSTATRRRTLARTLTLAWTLLLAAACTVSVEKTTPASRARGDVGSLAEGVREAAQADIDAVAVAGVSVAVARDGDIVLAEGYGFADLENRVEAKPETVYRIGSITKQFTAAAVLQLVEQGRIDLQADLRDYLPDYPTGGRTVTVHRLLNHTSGIKSYTGLGEEWSKTIRLDLSHDELLGLIRDKPFDFEPGERWSYNNSGYYLLGVILEEVTGQPYGEWLEQQIFAPLGLEATTYCDEERLIPWRAEGYRARDGALLNDEYLSMSQPFAAGSLCSSVLDLVRWQQALAGGEVVSPETYEQMTTPGMLNDGAALTYGYGLAVGELDEHRRIAHGGGINGFVTMLARYPDDALDVVVLTNTEGRTAGRLEERAARLALGLEIVEVADLPVSEQEAEAYVGAYDMGELTMTVTYRDGRLWAVATGQDETRLRAQGEHVFVPTFDDSVRITFTLEDGRATALSLLQGGQEIAGRRIE